MIEMNVHTYILSDAMKYQGTQLGWFKRMYQLLCLDITHVKGYIEQLYMASLHKVTLSSTCPDLKLDCCAKKPLSEPN